MKKCLSCAILTVIFVMLSACGSTNTPNPDKNISLTELQERMLAADTTLPEMTKVTDEDKQAELNFSYLTDLNYDIVDSYFYAYASDGTAEEIAVIKLKDKSDAAAMMKAMNEHVAQRKGTFQEYAPEQVAMAEKAVVISNGSYIALIISSKNGMVQKAFRDSFDE